jgi:hypothetical protein
MRMKFLFVDYPRLFRAHRLVGLTVLFIENCTLRDIDGVAFLTPSLLSFEARAVRSALAALAVCTVTAEVLSRTGDRTQLRL